MSISYYTEAIVLYRTDFQEQDQFITCFTEQFGKRTFFAQGVKKSVSKQSGNLEPGSRGILQWVRGRHIDRITHMEREGEVGSIYANWTRLGLLGTSLALVHETSVELQRQEEIYFLLQEYIDRLGEYPIPFLYAVSIQFIFQLFTFLGFQPFLQDSNLYSCFKERDTYFSKDQFQAGIRSLRSFGEWHIEKKLSSLRMVDSLSPTW